MEKLTNRYIVICGATGGNSPLSGGSLMSLAPILKIEKSSVVKAMEGDGGVVLESNTYISVVQSLEISTQTGIKKALYLFFGKKLRNGNHYLNADFEDTFQSIIKINERFIDN